MALGFLDRLLTIVVTATLTSAAWIVAGSVYFDWESPDRAPRAARNVPGVAEGQQKSMEVSTGASSAPAGSAPLLVPVAGVSAAQLTDTFDDDRGGRPHEALDIMAAAGTPVIAAAPGTVEKLFRSDAGGNTIYVRSADGRTIHYYAHLRDYAAGLEEGRQVARGDRLGTVGSSGNASPDAPHLHFAILRTTPEAEWWEPATALNPLPLLRNQ